jgi:hypothetical protein
VRCLCALAVSDEPATLVSEAANNDHDEVDDPPNAEASTGEKHENTRADLAYVEAVKPKVAEEDAEDEGCDETLIAGVVGCHIFTLLPAQYIVARL